VCVCCSLVQMADSSVRETLTPRRSRRKRRPLMCRLCGCPLHDPTPPKRPRRHGQSPPGGGSQTGGGSPRRGSITGGCAGFRAAFDRLNSTTPTSTLSGATSLARTTTDQRLNCGGGGIPTDLRSGASYLRSTTSNNGWWRGSVVERRSLAGELSLSCARPAADG